MRPSLMSVFGTAAVLVFCNFAVFPVESRKRIIVTTKVEVECEDKRYVELTGGTFQNEEGETAMNVTFKSKIDISPKAKFGIRTFLILSNGRRVLMFQYEKPVKEAMEMEAFDAGTFRDKYGSPPWIWPLKKGVTYSSCGWVPDDSKYSTAVPDGNYIIQFYMTLPNRYKTLLFNWFTLKG